MSQLERYALQANLDHTLALWLDAISAGQYAMAERIMTWRALVRALLRNEV